jgi:hypothetical protein
MRVKELKEIYQLRELPTGAKPKGDLEPLEYFGIIRPFMLRRLTIFNGGGYSGRARSWPGSHRAGRAGVAPAPRRSPPGWAR